MQSFDSEKQHLLNRNSPRSEGWGFHSVHHQKWIVLALLMTSFIFLIHALSAKGSAAQKSADTTEVYQEPEIEPKYRQGVPNHLTREDYWLSGRNIYNEAFVEYTLYCSDKGETDCKAEISGNYKERCQKNSKCEVVDEFRFMTKNAFNPYDPNDVKRMYDELGHLHPKKTSIQKLSQRQKLMRLEL